MTKGLRVAFWPSYERCPGERVDNLHMRQKDPAWKWARRKLDIFGLFARFHAVLHVAVPTYRGTSVPLAPQVAEGILSSRMSQPDPSNRQTPFQPSLYRGALEKHSLIDRVKDSSCTTRRARGTFLTNTHSLSSFFPFLLLHFTPYATHVLLTRQTSFFLPRPTPPSSSKLLWMLDGRAPPPPPPPPLASD